MSRFKIISTEKKARTGILETPHGSIKTPVFMPVGTQASVKSIDSSDLMTMDAPVILANIYHLLLRPGIQTISSFGGIHSFMNWNRPVLTDSGGFQLFSLNHLSKIEGDSVKVKSYIDWKIHTLTPENIILFQEEIGSDIMMPLDICISANSSKEQHINAVKKTSIWAEQSKKNQQKKDSLLFGIIQGGRSNQLREISAKSLIEIGFDGYSIGGVSTGEKKADMYKTIRLSTQMIPNEFPRYLMGIGSPEDLVTAVSEGVDMFDCVLPTRIARNGALFTKEGRINIYTSQFRLSNVPIQEDCDCYTCLNYTTGYLHHLFKAKELLGYRLATIHNLRFNLRLMELIQQNISNHTFECFKKDFLETFIPPNETVRIHQKEKWIQSVQDKK